MYIMKTLNPNWNDLKKIAATRVPELLYQTEYSFVGLIDLNDVVLMLSPVKIFLLPLILTNGFVN